ncbi:hypothetical protein MBANPS3_004944 [Mucor bainieri]
MAKGANKKTAWKGIQKKASDADRPASIASQDSRKTTESKDDSKKSKEAVTRSRSSSLTSDNFEDALSEEEEDDEEDEDDDYFQDEDPEEEKKKKEVEKMKEMAIAQDKKRSTSAKKEEAEKEEPQEAVTEAESAKKNPSRMSFILPALQNHGFSDEDDDDDDSVSLKDPNETARHDDTKEKEEEDKTKEDLEKHAVGSSSSSSDLIAEIEALEVASTPIAATAPKPAVAAESPVIEKAVVSEKPATYEPIPVERPYVPPTPVAAVPESKVEAPLETVKQPIPDEIHTVKEVSEHKEESTATPTVTAASTDEIPAVIPTDVATQEIQPDIPAAAKDTTQQEKEDPAIAVHTNGSNSTQQTTARSSLDALDTTPSGESEAALNQEETVPEKPAFNHLAAILPAVEESVKNVTTEKPKVVVDNDAHVLPEDHDRAKYSREFEYPIEDPIDLDMFKDNVISIQAIDPKDIPVNNMKPYEQEKAGKSLRLDRESRRGADRACYR